MPDDDPASVQIIMCIRHYRFSSLRGVGFAAALDVVMFADKYDVVPLLLPFVEVLGITNYTASRVNYNFYTALLISYTVGDKDSVERWIEEAAFCGSEVSCSWVKLHRNTSSFLKLHEDSPLLRDNPSLRTENLCIGLLNDALNGTTP